MLFLLNRQLSQHERVQKIRKGNAKNFHSSVANSETDCGEILNRGFSKIIDKTTFSKNFITFYIKDLNKIIWKKKKIAWYIKQNDTKIYMHTYIHLHEWQNTTMLIQQKRYYIQDMFRGRCLYIHIDISRYVVCALYLSCNYHLGYCISLLLSKDNL